MSRTIGILLYIDYRSLTGDTSTDGQYKSYCLRCYSSNTSWFVSILERPARRMWPILEEHVGPYALHCNFCGIVFWGKYDMLIFKGAVPGDSPEKIAGQDYPSRLPDMQNYYMPPEIPLEDVDYSENEDDDDDSDDNGCTCEECRSYRE